MEEFQKINSDLFAMEALQPEQMRKIIGGYNVISGPGSMKIENADYGNTIRSWASDADDGSKQGVSYSGGDAVLYGMEVYEGTISSLGNSFKVPFPSAGGVIVINVNPPACGKSKNNLNSNLD